MSQSLTYDSARRSFYALEELQEVFRYRNLIFQLARRDIVTRYKRSFLGVAWTMLNPLGMMLVLTVAFSAILRGGPGYPAYVLSGLIGWTFFGQATTAAMVNLVWGGGLLHRIYMPRTSFAIAAIITGFINISLSVVPLLVVMLVVGVPVRATVLLFPLAVLLIAAFALGVGLLISTFAVYFPDVAEMYQIVLSAWMYLTPVIYRAEQLPEQYRWALTHLNPMFYLLRVFRAVTYDGRLPTAAEILPALAIALGALVLGWLVFTKKADEFAYRI